MALLKNFLTDSGVTVSNGYIKIVEQSGDKAGITLRVRRFISKEKADENKPVDNDLLYAFVPSVADNAPNFIAQGYAYLKTLPEYADAMDC